MNQTIDPLLQPNGLTRADLRTPTFAGGADESTRRPMSIPGFRGEIASVHAAKRDVSARRQSGASAATATAQGREWNRRDTRQTRYHRERGAVLNARLPPGTADIQIEAFRGYRAS